MLCVGICEILILVWVLANISVCFADVYVPAVRVYVYDVPKISQLLCIQVKRKNRLVRVQARHIQVILVEHKLN